MVVSDMRFIETGTSERNARLHASTKQALASKVANSTGSALKDYPDEVGYFPYVVVDPEHKPHIGSDENLCADDDAERATVFTACLGFPHLTISPHSRRQFSVKKLVRTGNCESDAVLAADDSTVQTVLHERERLRMRVISDDHSAALDADTELTANPTEKLLINARRVAERKWGDGSAQNIRRVLLFERNASRRDRLEVSVDDIDAELVDARIAGKTCSPPLPQSPEQKQVLLYWLDNPDASLAEVIKQTGVSRGQFETFRLNLPRLSCYDRSAIERMEFDWESMTTNLNRWMENSDHAVYSCSECDFWTYSPSSLSSHKVNSSDHKTRRVLENERPDGAVPAGPQSEVTFDTTSVDEMLELYNEGAKPDPDDGGDSSQTLVEPVLEEDSAGAPDEGEQDEEHSVVVRATETIDDSPPASTTETDTREGQQESVETDVDTDPSVVDVLDCDDPVGVLSTALDVSRDEVLLRVCSTLTEVERERIRAELSDSEGSESEEGESFDDHVTSVLVTGESVTKRRSEDTPQV